MLCKIFFGYILGYSFGIKPYVGAKFCVVLLSQRNSLAVRDLGPSRSQRVFPRRKAFTKVILKSFPVCPCFRFVKAKPVFTLYAGCVCIYYFFFFVTKVLEINKVEVELKCAADGGKYLSNNT